MSVQNIGLFHFYGQSPSFRAFCTTIAFQTYMPPINILVENVFIYLSVITVAFMLLFIGVQYSMMAHSLSHVLLGGTPSHRNNLYLSGGKYIFGVTFFQQ